MPMRRGRPGLLGTVARTAVIAGTATAVSGKVSQRSASKAAQQEQAAAYQQQQEAERQQAAAPPVPPQAAAPDDRIAKIKELGEMKSQGLLTEEEFTAEKSRILGS